MSFSGVSPSRLTQDRVNRGLTLTPVPKPPLRPEALSAYHVLDIMHALLEASEAGRHIELSSGGERPAPLPLGLRPGTLDP